MKIFTRSVLFMSLLCLTFCLKAGGGMLYTPDLAEPVLQTAPNETDVVIADPNETLPNEPMVWRVYPHSLNGQPVDEQDNMVVNGIPISFMVPIEDQVISNLDLTPFNEGNPVETIQMRGNRTDVNLIQIRGNRANTNVFEISSNPTNENQLQVRGYRGGNPFLINPETNIEPIQVQEIVVEPLQMRGAINSGVNYLIAPPVQVQQVQVQQIQIQQTLNAYQEVHEESIGEKNYGAGAEAIDAADMQIWPNPSLGEVNLKAIIPGESKAHLQVISADGKIVRQSTLEGMEEQFNDQLFLNGLPDGVYHIRIQTESHVLNKQLVLQK